LKLALVKMIGESTVDWTHVVF